MKKLDFDYKLIKAMPYGSSVDTAFTDKVMQRVASLPLSSTLNTNRGHKKPFLYRLRHLPKFAIVLLAIAVLFTISGVTYAVIETVKQAKMNVTLEQSGTNNFGREQINVSFDSCAEGKKAGTTYELKKGSGLSAEDGAKVVQARCDLDFMDAWLQNDQKSSGKDYGHFFNVGGVQSVIGTLTGVPGTDVTIHTKPAFLEQERDQTLPFPEGVRVVEQGQIVDRGTLKPGDTLLYFSPRISGRDPSSDAPDTIVIFKLGLEAKYYGLDMRSYVKARGACNNNPERTCLKPNSINTVSLIVGRGGAWTDPVNGQTMKEAQGKVVSWSNRDIKLDVGDGVIYTFTTTSNVIDTYNTSTVYGLKSLDNIYAKTNPEALKVGIGDSLEIAYQEDQNKSSQTIEWSKTLSYGLMVERTTQDLEVLIKY